MVLDAVTAWTRGEPAWLDSLGRQLQENLSSALAAAGDPAEGVKRFLQGTWLGHPMHPAMTDVPVGAWTTALVLDILGNEEGAKTAIGFGVLTSVPTAVAGMADWHETDGTTRRMGLAHAILNTAALGCYITSLIARRGRRQTLGVGLSMTGLGLVMWSAYMGGELAYTLGQGVKPEALNPPAKP